MKNKKGTADVIALLRKIGIIIIILIILLFIVPGPVMGLYKSITKTIKEWAGIEEETEPVAQVGDCTIRSAYWSSDQVKVGQEVILTINADEKCKDKDTTFSIFEYDFISKDDNIYTSLIIKYQDNKYSHKWNTTCDEYFSCKYYFTAIIDSIEIKSDDKLTVKK